MESHNYSYMRFRTKSGGFETGSVKIDAQGKITVSSYWPFGAQRQGSGLKPFNTGSFPGSSFQEDSSGDFLAHDDGQGAYDFVFRHTGTESSRWTRRTARSLACS